MSIRLQILLAEEELLEIKRLAAQEHLTVFAWVRRAIQHEQRERPRSVVQQKQEILHRYSAIQRLDAIQPAQCRLSQPFLLVVPVKAAA
jgi:hypothetical protein